jgi:hypothetical protein
MSILWLPEDVWILILPNIKNTYKGILSSVCKKWYNILGTNHKISLLEIIKMGRINLVKWSLDNCKSIHYSYVSLLLYEAANNHFPGIFDLLLKQKWCYFDDNIFIKLAQNNNIKALNILIKNRLVPRKSVVDAIKNNNKELKSWIKQNNL